MIFKAKPIPSTQVNNMYNGGSWKSQCCYLDPVTHKYCCDPVIKKQYCSKHLKLQIKHLEAELNRIQNRMGVIINELHNLNDW